MEKFWKIMIGTAVVFSLAACSPTTNKSAKNESSGSQPETQVKEVVEKLPDADAPELELVSVFYPNADGTGLKQSVEGVDFADADSLVELLVEKGVLPEGTEVLDFTTEGEIGSQISGPGESTTVTIVSNATLNLSQPPADSDKTLMETAIGNTFTESLNIQKLTIQVNGEVYAADVEFNDNYAKLK